MELRGEEQLRDALSPILYPNAASVIYSVKPSRSLFLFRIGLSGRMSRSDAFRLDESNECLPCIVSKVS